MTHESNDIWRRQQRFRLTLLLTENNVNSRTQTVKVIVRNAGVVENLSHMENSSHLHILIM